MIRTITEGEAPSLAIPATDELILWNGPAISAKEGLVCILGPGRPGFVAVGSWDGDEASLLGVPLADLRLPLARPEVQAHLVGWLGRGERCPHGLACHGLHPDTAHSPCPSGWSGCDGYLRPPADLYHLLKPAALGGLPDWIRLALIWGNVVRVAAGMSAIPDVLGEPWLNDPKCGRGSLDHKRGDTYAVEAPSQAWKTWRVRVTDPRNTRRILGRFGSRAEADAFALSLGIALTDKTPAGRVIRFEVPDATP